MASCTPDSASLGRIPGLGITAESVPQPLCFHLWVTITAIKARTGLQVLRPLPPEDDGVVDDGTFQAPSLVLIFSDRVSYMPAGNPRCSSLSVWTASMTDA